MKSKKQGRLITYVVWLHNKVDDRDDEPQRIKARSKEDAKKSMSMYESHRFYIGEAYTLPEFYKRHPDWKGLI